MSYAKGLSLLKPWCLSLAFALASVGCSAGDPANPETGEGAVAQSESDLVARRLCAGPEGLQCGANQYCNGVAVGKCPSKASYGVCAARPSICTKEFRPVCGCDG